MTRRAVAERQPLFCAVRNSQLFRPGSVVVCWLLFSGSLRPLSRRGSCPLISGLRAFRASFPPLHLGFRAFPASFLPATLGSPCFSGVVPVRFFRGFTAVARNVRRPPVSGYSNGGYSLKRVCFIPTRFLQMIIIYICIKKTAKYYNKILVIKN